MLLLFLAHLNTGINFFYLLFKYLFSFLFEVILLLNFSVKCLSDFVLELLIYKIEKKYNNGSVFKGCYSSKTFKRVSFVSLIPGDIVYLEKDQEIPADILILDTSDFIDKEAICHVSNEKTDGNPYLSNKLACSLTSLPKDSTMKKKFEKYSELLTGSVEYLQNKRTEDFKGHFKLKGNPKIEVLNLEHFIDRGSVLRRTNWYF